MNYITITLQNSILEYIYVISDNKHEAKDYIQFYSLAFKNNILKIVYY